MDITLDSSDEVYFPVKAALAFLVLEQSKEISRPPENIETNNDRMKLIKKAVSIVLDERDMRLPRDQVRYLEIATGVLVSNEDFMARLNNNPTTHDTTVLHEVDCRLANQIIDDAFTRFFGL